MEVSHNHPHFNGEVHIRKAQVDHLSQGEQKEIMADQLEAVAKQLRGLDAGSLAGSSALTNLETMSKNLCTSRRKCDEVIGGKFAANGPAFDLLLDLFYHDCLGQDVSITSAIIASRCAPTTGLRLIALLGEENVITKRSDPNDNRRQFVGLTAKGRSAVIECLEQYSWLNSPI